MWDQKLEKKGVLRLPLSFPSTNQWIYCPVVMGQCCVKKTIE